MFAWLLAAYIAGQSGDLTTTIIALQKPHIFSEANPLLGNDLNRIVLTKLVINTGTIIIINKSRKKHPKATYIALASLAILGTAATIHNVRELRKY